MSPMTLYIVKLIEVFDGSFPTSCIIGIYTEIGMARLRMREYWRETKFDSTSQTDDRIASDINGDIFSISVIEIITDRACNIDMFEGAMDQ